MRSTEPRPDQTNELKQQSTENCEDQESCEIPFALEPAHKRRGGWGWERNSLNQIPEILLLAAFSRLMVSSDFPIFFSCRAANF